MSARSTGVLGTHRTYTSVSAAVVVGNVPEGSVGIGHKAELLAVIALTITVMTVPGSLRPTP